MQAKTKHILTKKYSQVFRFRLHSTDNMNKTAQQLGIQNFSKTFWPTIVCCYWIIYAFCFFWYGIVGISTIMILGNIIATTMFLGGLCEKAVKLIAKTEYGEIM